MSIISWFKSYYLGIDETDECRQTSDYTFDINNFRCRDNSVWTATKHPNNTYSYTHNHRYGNTKFIGKGCRLCSNNNGCIFIAYTDVRSCFFINEVRNHYSVLDRQVYKPLSILGLNQIVNSYEYPSWKSRLKVNGYIYDDFLSDMAVNHISADNPDLLHEITDYVNRFKLHTNNVDSLPRIIDSIVKSRFIESHVYPTPIDNYKKEGYYHFDDVGHILNVDIYEGFLCSDRDVRTFARNFNFLGHEFTEDKRFLRLGSHVIGRGNERQRHAMREVLIQIPKNHLILNALNDLMNSKLDLDTRAERIRNMAIPLSTSITNLEYRQLCDCCATQDRNIWNFG